MIFTLKVSVYALHVVLINIQENIYMHYDHYMSHWFHYDNIMWWPL